MRVIELNRVGAQSSNDRTTSYHHLFDSVGSYTINTDIGFYSLTLSGSYNSEREYIKSNPLYIDVATKEIDALVAEIDSVWYVDRYDYRAALSVVQLEDLVFYLNGTTSPLGLDRADRYAHRAMLLSPTDPQIYLAYAETQFRRGDIKTARELYRKAISLNPRYLDAQLSFVNFERYFGTPKDLQAAKDAMKDYFPDYIFTS